MSQVSLIVKLPDGRQQTLHMSSEAYTLFLAAAQIGIEGNGEEAGSEESAGSDAAWDAADEMIRFANAADCTDAGFPEEAHLGLPQPIDPLGTLISGWCQSYGEFDVITPIN